jgi:aspartyl aminopeptidase
VAWRRDTRLDVTAGLRVVGAHTDSPNLRLKPHPDVRAAQSPLWRQVAVETYGGGLWNSWLDRDLGLAGLLVVADDTAGPTRLNEVLVRIDEPWLRIPQLAIHLDRAITTDGLRLDPQRHLTPVWGLGTGSRDGHGIVAAIAEAHGINPDRVVSFELMCHDLAAPTIAGADGAFIASARIDNLVSCWAAVSALAGLDHDQPADAPLPMVCLFDHEEVGSASAAGAGSPLLADVVTRIGSPSDDQQGFDVIDLARWRAASTVVSCDGAHATHPNWPERHEPDHHIALDGGIVVKHNANQRYATEATGTAWLRTVANAAGVPLQDFVMRNDMPCGSTIGPITAAGVGLTTVDIGVAQLAMHSVREMCGTTDAQRLVTLLGACLTS